AGLGPLHPLRGCFERHAEAAQQRARLLIRLCRGHDRDLHAAQPVDLVVVDLREDQLLLQAEREVAAAVEAAVRDALEVANARERDRHELLVEMPHALAAQRDLQADRHADAQLEVRDRPAGLRDHRTLAGDLGEVRRRGVHGLGVPDRFAHADVHAGDDDLARGTVDLLHLATLAAIAAGDDDHLVALADAQIARHYSTCSISRLRRGDTLRAGWTRSPRQSRFSLVFIGPPARARRSS